MNLKHGFAMINVIASGSTGNCILLSIGDDMLLLDAGVPVKHIQRALGFNLSGLSACLVTHGHQDHCLAVDDLLARGVTVFGPMSLDKRRYIEARPNWTYTTGDRAWRVRAIEACHDIPCLGYAICHDATGWTALYLVDTGYVRNVPENVDCLLIECNHDPDTINGNLYSGELDIHLHSRITRYHLGLDSLERMIRENHWNTRVQEIWLLHLSEHNANWQLCQDTITGMVRCPVYLPPEAPGCPQIDFTSQRHTQGHL